MSNRAPCNICKFCDKKLKIGVKFSGCEILVTDKYTGKITGYVCQDCWYEEPPENIL